jgi:hypothetical protein
MRFEEFRAFRLGVTLECGGLAPLSPRSSLIETKAAPGRRTPKRRVKSKLHHYQATVSCKLWNTVELRTVKKLRRIIFSTARKFFSSPGEALLLLRMAWWVAVVSAAARFYSLPRALQIVAGNRDETGPSHAAATQDELARAIDLLLSADVLIFKPICWKRAAVLHRYLLRNGVNTRIMFGVRNETGGKVDGHAWLEANGKPILENAPPEYVVTYSFPSNDPFRVWNSFGAD